MSEGLRVARHVGTDSPTVFMMDTWATVPYYTAYLSRALLANGVRVQIGSMTYYLDKECFESRGLRVDPGLVDVVGRRDLPGALRKALKLVEGVVNLAALTVRFFFARPEVVHVQFLPLLRTRFPVDAWFVSLWRRRGSKVVLTVHDLLPHDTAMQYKQEFLKLYASVDALICHSEAIRARLEAEFDVPAEKIAVIPHGPFFFDLPETDASAVAATLGMKPEQQMVLWQGIIFPYKGVDLLLEAWRRVEAANERLCLLVLGTGAQALTAALEEQARRLGLKRVVFDFRFCSAEELAAAYRVALMVVYPYRAITTSGALATGLALGKAIVASDLPVFREMLTDGVDALLVAPGDTDALADAILRLASDEALRARLSAAVKAKEFGAASWIAIARQTRQVYANVLAGRAASVML